MTNACGTLPYMAPEMFNQKGYTESVDIWSLGIMTYILLTGRLPYS